MIRAGNTADAPSTVAVLMIVAELNMCVKNCLRDDGRSPAAALLG
jgi:hypothetical protein